MNIETFKHTLGVDSAAGLVRTLARKYMNHDVLLSVFLEVYTLVALPMEPRGVPPTRIVEHCMVFGSG